MRGAYWIPCLLALLTLGGCSGGGEDDGPSAAECSETREDIRKKAASYGVPADGVCNNPSPTIQSNFASACAKAQQCSDVGR